LGEPAGAFGASLMCGHPRRVNPTAYAPIISGA
jgi:hypothetical protein